MKKAIKQQMSLETYKKKVKECLIKSLGEKEANSLMTSYEKELSYPYQKNYSPEAVSAGIISGLI